MSYFILLEVAVTLVGAIPFGSPGQSAHYTVTGLFDPPDQNVVEFSITLGNTEFQADVRYQWIHLKGVKQNGQSYTMSALVDGWPGDPGIRTARYLFQEADAPAWEYVHASTGEAFLPELRGWSILFPTGVDGSKEPFADRVHYLGFDFVLTEEQQTEIPRIPPTKRIPLRPDMRIGTGRNFRDVEGGRLLANEEYEYTPYSQEDMEELIAAGFNHFWVSEEQYEWMQGQPVFAVHPRRGDRYPEMLYRSNMVGGHAYYDEPGWRAQRKIRPEHTLTEIAQLVVEATQEQPSRTESFHRTLAGRPDISLGDLDLRHPLPSWETAVSTVWYQMRAGAIGAVHEGRYVTYGQPLALNFHYGCQIPPYPEYLLRYYYAFLRGAARHFGGNWGMAIYGQTEAQVAPLAFTLAYDMGARYFWFWTSDHAAHVPYPEQVNLTRLLTSHARQHPNRDMDALLHVAKTAIVLPDGYTFEWSGLLYNHPAHHLERTNEQGVTHRQVLHNAAVEMERLLRLGIDFDIVVDADGFDGEGYEELIYVRSHGMISIVRGDAEEILEIPRTPPRPNHQTTLKIEATLQRNSENPRQVNLRAVSSGGSPPLGMDIGRDSETGERQRILVIWEHYRPDGSYRLLRGTEHSLALDPGHHRFRAGTADSYGQIADQWLEVDISE